MPNEITPSNNDYEKEYVRARGKALLRKIIDEFQIDGKLTYNDEETRMHAFKRVTELVELEKSKLTGPEQYYVREYVREGMLGNTDPDKWLDLHFTENVEAALAQHERSKYDYGTLKDKLIFCAIPQFHASKTPLQKLIGIFVISGCVIVVGIVPFMVLVLLLYGRRFASLIPQQLFGAYGSMVGTCAALIYIFAISTYFTWQFHRIGKIKQREYKKILDARHGR